MIFALHHLQTASGGRGSSQTGDLGFLEKFDTDYMTLSNQTVCSNPKTTLKSILIINIKNPLINAFQNEPKKCPDGALTNPTNYSLRLSGGKHGSPLGVTGWHVRAEVV